jgi:gluconolactonase
MFEHVIPVVVASGLQSPEGPSFDRNGILHLVDWDAKWIYQITLDGELKEFVYTGGIPTGTKFHINGHLYVADGARGILDISTEGIIQVVANEWQRKTFRGPNDLVFAHNGDLYFSDPAGSDAEHPIGNVFLLRRDGSLELFAGGFQFPNGVALSEDGHTLFVAETIQNQILAFELDGNGLEKSCRVFAKMEGGLGPDGMAFGTDGNLYVAHFGKGCVAVINPDGEVIDEIAAGGAKPTNVAFWGSSLFVTEVEKGQVVRLDIGIHGQVLYGLEGDEHLWIG